MQLADSVANSLPHVIDIRLLELRYVPQNILDCQHSELQPSQVLLYHLYLNRYCNIQLIAQPIH